MTTPNPVSSVLFVLAIVGMAACSGGPGSAGGGLEPDSGTGTGSGSGTGSSSSSNDGWGDHTNVEAIVEASCTGCHGDSWSSCWNAQASASTLEGAVSSGFMPPGGLSASDKSVFLAWLGGGAPCTGVNAGGGGGGGSDAGYAPPPIIVAGEAVMQ